MVVPLVQDLMVPPAPLEVDMEWDHLLERDTEVVPLDLPLEEKWDMDDEVHLTWEDRLLIRERVLATIGARPQAVVS